MKPNSIGPDFEKHVNGLQEETDRKMGCLERTQNISSVRVAEEPVNPGCCQGREEMMRCSDFFCIVSFVFRPFGTSCVFVSFYTTVLCLIP